MPRRINTLTLQATGGNPPDTYVDKIIKYIPSDVVAAWVAATGLIAGAANIPKTTLLWICFAAGAIITPFWVLRQTGTPSGPPQYKHAAVSTVSFIVWVFALGGPFATLSWYNPIYGSLLLIFVTLAIGLVDP